MSEPRLILASASPRRRELLSEAGFVFDIDAADIDEEDHPPDLSPSELVQYLAFRKAQAVADRHPDDVVLAADTLVAFGDRVFGKPANSVEARKMLKLLEGTTQIVVSGVAVIRKSAHWVRRARVLSSVRMRPLSDDEIDRYIATGDWKGKAGGYGIQDQDPFVTRIAGCHTNIVGLPMTHTRKLLAESGMTPQNG